MHRPALLLVGLTIALVGTITFGTGQTSVSGQAQTIELDVSATDKDGFVADLHPEEFQVLDDGKKVALTSFSLVRATGRRTTDDDRRDVVLLLDDHAGVPAEGIEPIRQLASRFVLAAGPGDTVLVMGLRTVMDGANTDRATARAHIAAFGKGPTRLSNADEETEDLLALVRKLSTEWAKATPHRRLAIVCIWLPVCRAGEKEWTAPRREYPDWVDAISVTARANVVYYVATPRSDFAGARGTSLSERTGGDEFLGLASFGPAMNRVFDDLSHYYMLGYTAPASKKDTRSITVQVSRKGVTVRTRSRIGT